MFAPFSIGGGTRGAGGPRPPQISTPEINQHWLEITFKGAPDPVARELYFQTEYCMNIIQIPHSRTL